MPFQICNYNLPPPPEFARFIELPEDYLLRYNLSTNTIYVITRIDYLNNNSIALVKIAGIGELFECNPEMIVFYNNTPN